MSDEEQDFELIIENWREEYRVRATDVVETIGPLFQDAISKETADSLFKNQGVTEASLGHIRNSHSDFPYPLLVFIYSARFDAEFASYIVEDEGGIGMTLEELTERFSWKASRVTHALERLVVAADVFAGHYSAGLMESTEALALPLIWDVPTLEEGKGISPDAFWFTTFQFLCELSSGICAFAGFSKPFYEELKYILSNPCLKERLFWMDQDLRLYISMDESAETWSLDEIQLVFDRLSNKG